MRLPRGGVRAPAVSPSLSLYRLAYLAGHAEGAFDRLDTHNLQPKAEPDPEDTVQGREDASALKWSYLSGAQEFYDGHMRAWKSAMGGRKKKGPLGIPGIDAPSLYPEALWKPGGSTMMTAGSFHADIQAAIVSGTTYLVRFINSDIPEKARQQVKDQTPAWNAVVRAFTGHDRVKFGDVSQDDMYTMGEYITHTADWAEMAIGSKGYPYIHWWNRDSDIGGEAYQSSDRSPAGNTAEELASPYEMMALLEDIAGAYICTISTEKGCSQAELEYAKLMGSKNAFELKKQTVALRAQAKSEDAEDDADLRTSIHQRISVLKQLGGGSDATSGMSGRNYEESPDPGMYDVDVSPQFVQKAKQRMASVRWTEDLILPWLPAAVSKGMRGRKKLKDFVWDIAEKDTEYIATSFLGVVKKKEPWQIKQDEDHAARAVKFKQQQDELPPQLSGYKTAEYDPKLHGDMGI